MFIEPGGLISLRIHSFSATVENGFGKGEGIVLHQCRVRNRTFFDAFDPALTGWPLAASGE
jgi:hypothetical protein